MRSIHMRFVSLRLLQCLLGFALSASHAAHDPPQPAFLETHCYDCHGDDVQKGGLRLDTLGRNFNNRDDAQAWEEVYQRVATGEMPPPKHKRQPAPDERSAFVDSLRTSLLA